MVDDATVMRETLEWVLDTWPAPTPEAFARLHRVLTGRDSCAPDDPAVTERLLDVEGSPHP